MEHISLGAAFAHCFSTASYIIWLVIAIIALIACLWLTFFKIEGNGKIIPLAIGLLFFMLALLMRPVEISQNTSKDEAAKGIFIGY